MFIELLADIPERQLRTGHQYHEKPHIADVLIALGKAKAIKQSLADELLALRGGEVQSTLVDFASEPVWSIGRMPDGRVVITLRKQTECWKFKKPPENCPEEVAAQWKQMNKRTPEAIAVANEAQLEAAQIAQSRADARANEAKRW